MRACFGDTSYFLAILIPSDGSHAAARVWSQHHRTPMVTSEYVVVEVGNYLSGEATRTLFAGFLRALRSNRRVNVVPASSDLMQRGIDLYLARPDKSWSVTDCISFVIMREQGITDALTADRHFEQAGFTLLLQTGT